MRESARRGRRPDLTGLKGCHHGPTLAPSLVSVRRVGSVGLAIVAGARRTPSARSRAGGASAAVGQTAGRRRRRSPWYKVVRGGTFGIGMHADLVNFDAVTQSGTLHLSVLGLVQNGLLKWGKSTVVDHGKVACDLCESWTQIDPVTYEFKLRQGVRWHNVPPVNGRELVADDVKYTLERLQTGNFRNDRASAASNTSVEHHRGDRDARPYTVRDPPEGARRRVPLEHGRPVPADGGPRAGRGREGRHPQSGVIGTGPSC